MITARGYCNLLVEPGGHVALAIVVCAEAKHATATLGDNARVATARRDSHELLQRDGVRDGRLTPPAVAPAGHRATGQRAAVVVTRGHGINKGRRNGGGDICLAIVVRAPAAHKTRIAHGARVRVASIHTHLVIGSRGRHVGLLIRAHIRRRKGAPAHKAPVRSQSTRVACACDDSNLVTRGGPRNCCETAYLRAIVTLIAVPGAITPPVLIAPSAPLILACMNSGPPALHTTRIPRSDTASVICADSYRGAKQTLRRVDGASTDNIATDPDAACRS